MLHNLLFRLLDNPPVVDVLVAVARHLLLVGGASAVSVLNRVNRVMGVQPTGAAVGVAQGDLGPMQHLDGLVGHDGRQAALRRRRSHQEFCDPYNFCSK